MPMKLSLGDLHGLIVRALVNAGTIEESARDVADALVAAEADGLKGHGASRVPSYADHVRCGKVDGKATPVLHAAGRAGIRVDARMGYAYPACRQGLDRAAELVRETGIVGVAVANSHHFGPAGYHAERMAEKGLVALAFSNSPQAIAPWGGNRGLYGTNPIAMAVPRAGKPPMVADLSLSKVARGNILVAAQKGEPIPGDWALAPDGKPTTDPKLALKGTMLPIGDAKGAALAMMVEILSAALTGSHFGFEASSFFDNEGGPPVIGQFFLVIDPGPFSGGRFAERIETLFSAILAQDGTRLPGERRFALREKARRDGVEIPDALYKDISARAGA